ncbi:MAG TPA: VOC family protein [Solirubrobacteraceae bacterium]|jgi:predicted enzyme related to lactoylglutathione lyase|nr:VOC family protein [Solirubrobacteraceae bacterium]
MSDGTEIITRVDFVGVPTHDLPKAVEFYGETLGLERSVYLEERNYAEFETGNLTLSVIDAEKMGLEHVPVRSGIALHVDDVASVRATLEERGVSFAQDTFDTGVCHMAIFDDPDGNLLILHHRYAPPPPRS